MDSLTYEHQCDPAKGAICLRASTKAPNYLVWGRVTSEDPYIVNDVPLYRVETVPGWQAEAWILWELALLGKEKVMFEGQIQDYATAHYLRANVTIWGQSCWLTIRLEPLFHNSCMFELKLDAVDEISPKMLDRLDQLARLIFTLLKRWSEQDG